MLASENFSPDGQKRLWPSRVSQQHGKRTSINTFHKWQFKQSSWGPPTEALNGVISLGIEITAAKYNGHGKDGVKKNYRVW